METHRYRRIVVGTDFGPSAATVLDHAIEIARLAGASITLVHVCSDEILDRCRDRIAQLCTRATDIEITPVLRSGRAADKIHNIATEVGAGLIVIGRGRGIELGGIAAGVLLSATRPVLAVAIDPRFDAQ